MRYKYYIYGINIDQHLYFCESFLRDRFSRSVMDNSYSTKHPCILDSEEVDKIAEEYGLEKYGDFYLRRAGLGRAPGAFAISESHPFFNCDILLKRILGL